MMFAKFGAVACLAFAAAAAAAQDAPPAPPQIEGEIAAGDQTDGQGRRYDDIPVELVRGQRILVTAAPAGGSRVTPGLEIYAPGAASASAQRAAEGENRITRLGYTAPRTGTYLLRIVSGDAAAGRYTLAIRHNAAVTPSRGLSNSAVAPPRPAPGDQSSEAVGGGVPGPRARFIICPGHPRCPR